MEGRSAVFEMKNRPSLHWRCQYFGEMVEAGVPENCSSACFETNVPSCFNLWKRGGAHVPILTPSSQNEIVESSWNYRYKIPFNSISHKHRKEIPSITEGLVVQFQCNCMRSAWVDKEVWRVKTLNLTVSQSPLKEHGIWVNPLVFNHSSWENKSPSIFDLCIEIYFSKKKKKSDGNFCCMSW